MEPGQSFFLYVCLSVFFKFRIFSSSDPCSSVRLVCVCARLRAVTNSSEPALHPHPSLHITVICEPQRPGPCCSPAAVGTPRLFVSRDGWSALFCSARLTQRSLSDCRSVRARLLSESHSSLLHLPFTIISVKLMFFFVFFFWSN